MNDAAGCDGKVIPVRGPSTAPICNGCWRLFATDVQQMVDPQAHPGPGRTWYCPNFIPLDSMEANRDRA